MDELILGMASQIAEREDNVVVEDLRGVCFLPLMEHHRLTHSSGSHTVGGMTDPMVP